MNFSCNSFFLWCRVSSRGNESEENQSKREKRKLEGEAPRRGEEKVQSERVKNEPSVPLHYIDCIYMKASEFFFFLLAGPPSHFFRSCNADAALESMVRTEENTLNYAGNESAR